MSSTTRSPKIIGSAAFLALPASSQALYFHLDARAGEEGYLTTAPEVMERIDATAADMQALCDGRFVLPLPEGILIVRHAKLQDYLLGISIGKAPRPRKPKAETHARGPHGYVKLTDDEYTRLLKDLGEAELARVIEYVDGRAKATHNKNGWKDWNLVLRAASREGWGRRQSYQGQPPKPPSRAMRPPQRTYSAEDLKHIGVNLLD